MLNQDTKRKIDSCRQILVGKVPDPKAQVEQITTALIYKFMDDMDKEAQELGGKARFFTKAYEKYAWTKLMNAKLGGHDRLDLYIEAITSLSQNPHIPQLFRDIFKDTFLPYRNPETLSLFLKEVNGFSYGHSEDLGDAFEYLLSILGSQGDAGQFRTPRHIIDFIVAAVNPKKDETICDPACGTAGFLISAYKHILKQHNGLDDPENKEKPLTPDERKTLMDHFVGYDISPDMVRLSKVNLYLHGFPSPTIFEYDTLSSEEKWDESFDVMLANPPFMSPKGGIRPHKRFSVPANRSEVLFVDYILEHLRSKGRAGIIVPEGIIFQSAGAYKALRKMLVEDGLMAVVSLPAGVFNPYAGVKTSILLFDNEIAKKTKNILFLKIQNDGYGLGAQRREHEKNDLPLALEIIKKYKEVLSACHSVLDAGFIKKNLDSRFRGNDKWKEIAHLVAKEKIAETGDYNLTGERYKETIGRVNQKWPLVELGECVELNRGVVYSKKDEVLKDGFKILRATNISLDGNLVLDEIKIISKDLKLKESQKLRAGDIFICIASGSKDHIGKVAFIKEDTDYFFGGFMGAIRVKSEIVDPLYIFYLLKDQKFNKYLGNVISGANINNLNSGILSRYKIPLPPIEVQKEIVGQIEVKQNAIDHAKAIIQNLERERRYFGQSLRKLEGVEWAELDKICDIKSGGTPATNNKKYWEKGNIPWVGSAVCKDTFVNEAKEFITEAGLNNSSAKKFKAKTTLVALVGATIGKTGFLTFETTTNQNIAGLYPCDSQKLMPEYLFYAVQSLYSEFMKLGSGKFRMANLGFVKKLKIPLPSLATQKQLVAEMEEQEKIIEANKKLIGIMEQKIANVLSEI